VSACGPGCHLGFPIRISGRARARPLYDPGMDRAASRALTRAHTVVDHARDGVEGFVSVVGGKLTTYRLMAEDAADLACRKLGWRPPAGRPPSPCPAPSPAATTGWGNVSRPTSASGRGGTPTWSVSAS